MLYRPFVALVHFFIIFSDYYNIALSSFDEYAELCTAYMCKILSSSYFLHHKRTLQSDNVNVLNNKSTNNTSLNSPVAFQAATAANGTESLPDMLSGCLPSAATRTYKSALGLTAAAVEILERTSMFMIVMGKLVVVPFR